ncbi:MAG: PD-(D/E)XK nuclease family protein [Blastocatellia bacterium]|nr:MAG: PD-(D/E)XK nuclease family protein [Blastocatellia bacterium]
MPLSSGRRIEISTDAATRLHLAQEWIENYSADTEITLVAHSQEAANDLHLRVVESRAAAFGLKRVTLNFIASRLAQRTLIESGTAPATNLTFTAVVARAIHSLQSTKKLTYFAPVATKPGFPIAVAKTLFELRMNQVPSESLARLTRGGRDLAAIAETVETELAAAKLSDRAVLFEAAIQAIDSAEGVSWIGKPLLLFDLCLISKLEQRLIETLGQRAKSVLATAPSGDERTVTALEAALNTARTNNRVALGRHTQKSLTLIKEHLFQDTAPTRAELDDSVTLSNWPGEPRECVEIVRNIQMEATQGVPLDQIAVLLNSPGEYRAHLEESFARADIPSYFSQGTTSPDPAGRALLALLACAADGLSAKRFAEYLSLGELPAPESTKDVDAQWVAPDDELIQSEIETEEIETNLASSNLSTDPDDSPIVDGSLRTPARWERLIVDSAVIGGRDRWSRRLAGLANELQVRIDEAAPDEESLVLSLKRDLRDLNSLRNYALPLIEQLDRLPITATWGEWLARLRELTVNALRHPEGVLETLAELEPMSAVGPVDLYEVQLVLEPRLRDLRVKPPKRRFGRVFVGPIAAARGLSFKVVFVPGLAEKVFPRKVVEDPILPDIQRGDTDPRLTTRRDQLDNERAALRIAIGCATDRVYLSYPRVDVQQSRPRVPSFYALEALRAAEGALPGFEEVRTRAESTTRARLGWPAPADPNAAIDEAEYDLALLANLADLPKEQATGTANYLLTANKHLVRALRARSRRWLRRWTQNDGLVDPDQLGFESIARHQFANRPFSASALQLFADCPYRFFLSAVMRLELRQEPAAIEVIDPLTRGSLFHEAQFEILSGLRSKGLLPLKPDSLKVAFDFVEQALGHLSDSYEDQLAPAIPRVWIDGVNSIRADLREWLRRMTESNEVWVPHKFELSFGLGDYGPPHRDPDSVDHPVELIGDLKLRGSIDMVERGGTNYRVTDHKTGKARAEKDTVVGGGRYLQPLLYALACEKLLPGKVDSGRLYYCTADGGYEQRIVSLNDENTRILNSILSTIRQSLVDGFLPAAPDKDACKWCDYLAVCGAYEEKRTKDKPRDRLIQIKAMRKLP